MNHCKSNSEAALQQHPMTVPHVTGHRKRPLSPFASHGADAQDLGLGDAVHDLGDDYLLGRGYVL